MAFGCRTQRLCSLQIHCQEELSSTLWLAQGPDVCGQGMTACGPQAQSDVMVPVLINQKHSQYQEFSKFSASKCTLNFALTLPTFSQSIYFLSFWIRKINSFNFIGSLKLNRISRLPEVQWEKEENLSLLLLLYNLYKSFFYFTFAWSGKY
jgi:hypothetical protein